MTWCWACRQALLWDTCIGRQTLKVTFPDPFLFSSPPRGLQPGVILPLALNQPIVGKNRSGRRPKVKGRKPLAGRPLPCSFLDSLRLAWVPAPREGGFVLLALSITLGAVSTGVPTSPSPQPDSPSLGSPHPQLKGFLLRLYPFAASKDTGTCLPLEVVC